MYNGIRNKLNANIGPADRTARILAAIVLAGLTMLSDMLGWLDLGWFVAIPLLAAIYLMVTGNLCYSPMYRLFGWSTARKKEGD